MKLLTLNDTTNYILSCCYVDLDVDLDDDEKVKASVLMSSVDTCHQLKSLSLKSVNFTHDNLKDLLDNLPQLVTMEMEWCDYEGGDIDASVNVSCGIHTSIKNSKTSIQNS